MSSKVCYFFLIDIDTKSSFKGPAFVQYNTLVQLMTTQVYIMIQKLFIKKEKKGKKPQVRPLC